MQIRDLTPSELKAIQTVVDYDNQALPANAAQLTIEAAINKKVDDVLAYYVERAHRIDADTVKDAYIEANDSIKARIKAILED